MKPLSLALVFAVAAAACDKAETDKAERDRAEAPTAEPSEPQAQAAEPKPASPELAPKAQAAPKADDPHAGLPSYQVFEVDQLLVKSAVVPVDANSTDTREEYGTLPGALLLSSSKDYEMSELPSDKQKDLVFYCGSEKCQAAPKAAKRAKAAGYTNVHVMPAGIRGWVKAGKEVDRTS